MPEAIRHTNQKTQCSTPRCAENRIEGRRFCQPCADNLDRIKVELVEDPKFIYNKRSDNKNRQEAVPEVRPKKRQIARCKFLGCFDTRYVGSQFCFEHQTEEVE